MSGDGTHGETDSASRGKALPARPKAGAPTTQINFDGIPGPTHNYSGLARGNLASERIIDGEASYAGRRHMIADHR